MPWTQARANLSKWALINYANKLFIFTILNVKRIFDSIVSENLCCSGGGSVVSELPAWFLQPGQRWWMEEALLNPLSIFTGHPSCNCNMAQFFTVKRVWWPVWIAKDNDNATKAIQQSMTNTKATVYFPHSDGWQCNPVPLSLLWLQLLENWQTNVQLLMNCQTWFYWISTPTNNFARKKQTINQTKFGLDEFVSSIYLDGWNTNNYIINWNFCANIFAHLRCIVLRLCTILLPKNLY